jgi:hypothetical protein
MPVSDDQWAFGSDDETLFRLIKGEIPHQTVPTIFGTELIDEQIWQLLAYVRSIYQGTRARSIGKSHSHLRRPLVQHRHRAAEG